MSEFESKEFNKVVGGNVELAIGIIFRAQINPITTYPKLRRDSRPALVQLMHSNKFYIIIII